jgi:lysophospholipase L1-like esterase
MIVSRFSGKIFLASVFLGLCVCFSAAAQQTQIPPELDKFKPAKAPPATGLYLKESDRLAICGDSITEQKMYSRIIEDYLTMCVPDLSITVRQYGWSGERAPGFLARMTNDCLRFKPTIATTCYGMNDHEYRPYEDRIGKTYEENSRAIVDAFKANGVRVVLGSPGCVGKLPSWVKSATGTVDDLNLNLCNLRNIDIQIAEKENVRFADVFWPMLTAGVQARAKYQPSYAIAGKDGVHPGWAGQTVMAYAFLKAFGLDGNLGVFRMDLGRRRFFASKGHEMISGDNGEYQMKSSRYPFCPCEPAGLVAASYPECEKDNPASDSSIRSGMTLIPFDKDLNRFTLVVQNGNSPSYKVTWGDQTKTFTADKLNAGINLVEEFPINPFSAAFAKVDAVIAAKQAYETRQIKQIFHGPEGKADMEKAVEETEKERQKLADAIKAAFVPVTWTIKVHP